MSQNSGQISVEVKHSDGQHQHSNKSPHRSIEQTSLSNKTMTEQSMIQSSIIQQHRN